MEKSKVIEKLFFDIVTYSYLLLPAGLLVAKKNYRKEIIPVTIASYGFVFFWLLFFYKSVPKNLIHYYQSAYTFLEYSVFAFIFWRNIRLKKLKNFIILASVIFFIFQIIYATTAKKNRLDSVPIGIETILILIYIFFFFYEFSKTLTGSYIYNHYCFWISVGILIYLGGSFFFYILINHLSKDQVEAFGNLTYLAEIIKNALFTSAIFIYVRYPFKPKEKSPSVPYLDMI